MVRRLARFSEGAAKLEAACWVDGFDVACQYHQFDVAELLVREFRLTQVELLGARAGSACFEEACEHGDLAVVRWVLTAPPGEFRVGGPRACAHMYDWGGALTLACGYGHVGVVAALVEWANPSLGDIEEQKHSPYLAAFEYGELEVAGWLIAHFGPPRYALASALLKCDWEDFPAVVRLLHEGGVAAGEMYAALPATERTQRRGRWLSEHFGPAFGFGARWM